MREEAAILRKCAEQGLRLTGQRRVVARALAEIEGHPDAADIHARASRLDPRISLATVYRTLKLFEDVGAVEKLAFQDGRARYENAERAHHDHLIDLNDGRVIEFLEPEIERLQARIARKLGYRLIGHRLELYGVPLEEEPLDGEASRPPDAASRKNLA
ncbi:Fur family transcriptional regulator [Neomegalonema sp.]|uniref:Fur family transcriptional regulator n=1 Tax=Neomegalonema sp. TaxID=2039713 RepID=UPI00260D9917|nr:Fur family transcriptional regulator [Neomegalonema sp.]MDD2867934.1 Fur family transcriptional regulator [Neomegalonema sp.]